MKVIYAAVILIFICNNLFGQKKNSIGIDVRVDNPISSTINLDYSAVKTYKNDVKVNFGLVYERRLSKKSSFETKVFFKQLQTNYNYWVPGGSNFDYNLSLDGRENFTGVGCLYKLKIRALNFSAGPSLDYFLNWKSGQYSYLNHSSFQQSQLPNNWLPKVLSLGVSANCSYQCHLNNRLILEPQIGYFKNISLKQEIIGLAVQTKYLF